MRAAGGSYQSYGEEVHAPVVHPARIDVLAIRLHDLSAEFAPASHQSLRVDLLPERSLFFRRRMGSRRSRVARLIAATLEMDGFICALRPGLS
jgi:hypothetical protein